MITVENITKVFPGPKRHGDDVHALGGVSLHIRQGELVSIVGPSGSGKSALLFAIGGLSEPTSGEVRLAGKSIYGLDAGGRAALRNTDVGFVFQTFNLVPYLDCLSNVALPALIAGRSRADARAAAEAMLHRLGLSARAHHLALERGRERLCDPGPHGGCRRPGAERVAGVPRARGPAIRSRAGAACRVAGGLGRAERPRCDRGWRPAERHRLAPPGRAARHDDRRGARARHRRAPRHLRTAAGAGAPRRDQSAAGRDRVLRSELCAVGGAVAGVAIAVAIGASRPEFTLAPVPGIAALAALVATAAAAVAAAPSAFAAASRDPVADLQES